MKYKLKLITSYQPDGKLRTDKVALDEAAELDLLECKTAREAEDMVKDWHARGYVLAARRDLKDWGGAILYFAKKS